jgi:hypothetical protein
VHSVSSKVTSFFFSFVCDMRPLKKSSVIVEKIIIYETFFWIGRVWVQKCKLLSVLNGVIVRMLSSSSCSLNRNRR